MFAEADWTVGHLGADQGPENSGGWGGVEVEFTIYLKVVYIRELFYVMDVRMLALQLAVNVI